MSSRQKLNFTIPVPIAEKLRALVNERRRSAFVAEAIRERLEQLEQQELERTLTEGYIARREEDSRVNGEWEGGTLEGWPQ